ncbi:MAG: hypothetical protein JSS02_11035, partial [Planctomycetes bacterium]|nr:hypothetical protein [Planctomycetota bacterium]
MSRSFAPLRAVAVCLAFLALTSPGFAFQGTFFGDNQDVEDPAGAESPFNLESTTPLQDATGSTPDADAAAAADRIQARLMQEQMKDLQKQFAALQDKLTKKNQTPYIEVHAVSQMDTGIFGQNPTNIKEFGVLDNGSDFRRSRLTANGAIADNMNYFFQMDFSFPGRPTFTDVWMEVTKLPIFGTIRAGQ